ncbi:MAG: hypothetical protein ACRC1K_17500 [Planctomycetia bacterium]
MHRATCRRELGRAVQVRGKHMEDYPPRPHPQQRAAPTKHQDAGRATLGFEPRG